MTSLFETIDTFINQYADERTADWALVGNLVPLPVIIFSYLYFVQKCGPDFMRAKKPYDLKLAISIYNIGQVLSCIYIIKELFAAGWWDKYSIHCEPVDKDNMRMANVVWWTMMLKLSEFTETVFFVLRKKTNQVTTLHLYHHVSTLLVAWLCTKYSPGGMSTFPIIINCVVHILMYSYYLVSIHASKELQQKLNKWKRYITLIQMFQFCIILVFSAQGLIPTCDINRVMVYTFIPNVFLVFYLFYDFYQKSYKKKQ